jgi:hypothetical protein
MLGFGVPLVVCVVIAVILGVVLAFIYLLDLWTEVHGYLDEIREWWDDRRD